MGDPFKGFSLKKIGAGNKFRSGKGYAKRLGLRGAFRNLKDPSHGLEAANLSKQDIDKFEKLIAKRLKRKYVYTKGFNWKDRREIFHELEKLIKQGEITREDYKDFKKIVDKLSD